MYKIIAHRGVTSQAKENTINSFIMSLKDNYVGFECDIRMTLDKKFIIYHDAFFKGKLIRFLNRNEIQAPSLEDTLSLNTNKIIMLDIKDSLLDTNLFIKVLEKYKNAQIYIISFYDSVIKKLDIPNRFYKIGILNYVLNTKEKHFKYDFICLLNSFLTKQILDKYKSENKMLVIYGIKLSTIKYEYPYYIVNV